MSHSHAHPTAASHGPQTRGRTISWASHFDLFTRVLAVGRERAIREETLALAALQPGETVLDVGCGTGRLTRLAKRRVGDTGVVQGIDASPEMIAVARANARQESLDVAFQEGVIEALAVADQSVDVVLSSLMFHHLPGDLQKQGLAEIVRVLKPGGRLVIVDLLQPRGILGHIQLTFFFHGALRHGVDDLPGLMQPLGFKAIDQGRLTIGPIGYVMGTRAGDV